MRVTVVVNNEDTLYRSSHAEVFIVVLQALQTCSYGWVFFRLRLLRAALIVTVSWYDIARINKFLAHLKVKFDNGYLDVDNVVRSASRLDARETYKVIVLDIVEGGEGWDES